MARSVVDLEEELTKIWGLVGELSEQLASNKALVQQLKGRSDNVKGQATHVGSGFPLRRFNLDITDEEFTSEVEAFASHLVLENQQLQTDNKQLNALLKEYETTLETVMSKFRGMSHASQQHDLSLHSYYTSLLQTLQTAHSSAHLHDNTSLSLLLNRLSTLLRSALRSLGGEDVEVDLAAQLPGLLNGHAPSFDGESSSSGPSSPAKSNKAFKIPKAPPKPAPFSGYIPGASGGYAGTEGQADWAIEREMEILRLEEENRALRELLSISQEIVVEDPVPAPTPKEEIEEDILKNAGRKGSLTVEELEDDAAREAEDIERMEVYNHHLQTLGDGGDLPSGNTGLGMSASAMNGSSDGSGMSIGEAGAAARAEMMKGGAVGEVQDTGVIQSDSGGSTSPTTRQNILGFQAGEGPPPDEVFDESAE